MIYPALICFILLCSQLVLLYKFSHCGSKNLEKMKKIARWRCGTKLSKTNLKTTMSPLLTRPQGCKGCQKIPKTKLKTSVVSWIAKILRKLNETKKTFRKQGFFDIFCSILMGFHSFFNFGGILALQLIRVDFSLVVRIFDTPGTSGGVSIVE